MLLVQLLDARWSHLLQCPHAVSACSSSLLLELSPLPSLWFYWRVAISTSWGIRWPVIVPYPSKRGGDGLNRANKHLFPCCCYSVAQLCPTLWDPMDCSTPGFPVLHHLPELAQTHVHWVGEAIQSFHPLSPSESVLRIRWLQYWSFSFSIIPSNEYLGLIFFRIDWFDLLAVQGILKGLLQHNSSKASILQRSAFFMIQLSHDYWENHSLD